MARSTYYYYLKHPTKDKYEIEKQEIAGIFKSHKGRYGYRRVLNIMRSRGYVINHKTVLKLMTQLGLKGKQRKNSKSRRRSLILQAASIILELNVFYQESNLVICRNNNNPDGVFSKTPSGFFDI